MRPIATRVGGLLSISLAILLAPRAVSAQALDPDTLARLGQAQAESQLLEDRGGETAAPKPVYLTGTVGRLAGAGETGQMPAALGFNDTQWKLSRMRDRSMSRMRDMQWKQMRQMSKMRDQQWKMQRNLSKMRDRQWRMQHNLSRMRDRQWRTQHNLSRMRDRQWRMQHSLSRMRDQQWRLSNMRLRALNDLDRLRSRNLLRSIPDPRNQYTAVRAHEDIEFRRQKITKLATRVIPIPISHRLLKTSIKIFNKGFNIRNEMRIEQKYARLASQTHRFHFRSYNKNLGISRRGSLTINQEFRRGKNFSDYFSDHTRRTVRRNERIRVQTPDFNRYRNF